MPSPKDLPGFYFDPEKNRYFPIKGPIPGSKRPVPSVSSLSGESSGQNKIYHIHDSGTRKRLKSLELLYFRELCGREVISNRNRCAFRQEYEKLQASNPLVWKYPRVTCVSDSALEQLHGIVQTPRGLKEAYLLSVGTVCSIRLYEVGNIQQFDSGFNCMPEPVWPRHTKYEGHNNGIGSIRSSAEACASFTSNVSCIRRIGRDSPDLAADVSPIQRALFTTLGSGASGGTVNLLNLTEPLDFSLCLNRRISAITSFDRTIWTADCSRDGTKAIIGTNTGAALVNLETRASSWVYRTKSDIFSQQFDHSGNIVLCGLRNGAIIAIDVRKKQSQCLELSSRPPIVPSIRKAAHAFPVKRDKRSTKQRFEVQRNSTSSCDLFMPSSVCSLVALQSDNRYFLGSSMDGSIKLFDLRLLHRGAIQSYEGNVNSHSHLQLGVNPLETLVVSGGEDGCVRIWSIKTGELLLEQQMPNSVVRTVCWPQEIQGFGQTQFDGEKPFNINHSWGVWLGSWEQLFYMHGT